MKYKKINKWMEMKINIYISCFNFFSKIVYEHFVSISIEKRRIKY